LSLKKENLQQVLELIGQSESLRPLIAPLLKEVISYASELRPIIDAMKPQLESYRKFTAQNRIDTIRQYQAAGLSDELAVILVIDEDAALKKAFNNIGKSANSASKK